MACNVHIDLGLRTIAGAPAAELLASSMRLLPEALLLTETRAGMQTAIFANEAFLQLSGYSMTEVMDRDLSFLQGPETDPSAFIRFLQPPKTEQVSGHEVVLYKKDGTPFWDRVSTRTFADHCIQVHQEIGRQKEIERQLVVSQKREAVSHLVSGIAHDFNNLLTVIMVYSDLLVPKLENGGPFQRYVNEIQTASERGAHLVAQLLDLQREEIAEEQLVDPGQLVAEMHDLLKRVLGEAIRLSVQTEPGLARVRVRPARVQQVLLNLGINARDAMPDGGDLVISLSNLELDESNLASSPGALPGRYVLLEVKDTGKGMDAPTLAQIFRPFFTTKTNGQGTGLGLFTVNTIVRQWSGHICVHSQMGAGSAFRILFPVAVSTEAVPDRSPTLLLVEDEELVRRSVEAALALRGYKVLPAANAEEAVRISSSYPSEIALMLADLVMPGRSGLELAQEIRRRRPEMKVLFMSGYSHDARVHDPEVSNFFRKPFSAAALAVRIEELLQKATSV